MRSFVYLLIITTKTYLETRTWAFNTQSVPMSSDLVDPSLTDNESVSCAFYVDIHTSMWYFVEIHRQLLNECTFSFLSMEYEFRGSAKPMSRVTIENVTPLHFLFLSILLLIRRQLFLIHTSHICMRMEKYSEMKSIWK